MKLSALKRVIREAAKECYGWPVDKKIDIFGAKPKLAVGDPKDPKNPNLRHPKGPNSRDGMSSLEEGFKRPTSKELAEWSKGNFEEVDERDGESDPCEGCGEMAPSASLTQVKDDSGGSKYMCQMCMSGH